MSALVAMTTKLATALDVAGDSGDLMNVLKQTAFKGGATDSQMTALLIVANQYGLNPWTKEIYAFPDRNNGIVPVVGVDGWSRIINSHPQFDGMSFVQDDEACTCRMHRKDRTHPIEVTEWMGECKRDGVGPWKSHPKRMLRHKAMIQCARLAFGYVGIYDQDEAEKIGETDITPKGGHATAAAAAAQSVPDMPASERQALIADLEATRMEHGLNAFAEAWGALTVEQRTAIGKAEKDRIKDLQVVIDGEAVEVTE